MTEEEVLSAVRRAGENRRQILAHCNGTPPSTGSCGLWRRRLPGGSAAGGGPRPAHAARPAGPGQASGGGGLLFPRPTPATGRRPPRQSGGSGHDHQPLPLRPGPGRPHHPAPGYAGPSAGSPWRLRPAPPCGGPRAASRWTRGSGSACTRPFRL